MNSRDGSQDVRKRQINSIKVFNYDVREVRPDMEYQIGFTVAGKPYALCVHIPPSFPVEKPAMWVVPEMSHPWLSSLGHVVGAPGLKNFSVHSDLGMVVQAVVRELEKSGSGTSIIPNGYDSKALITSVITQENHRTHVFSHNQQHTHYYLPPPIPPFIPELEKLTSEEIRDLISSPESLTAFVDSLPQAEKISADLEQEMEQIEKLAKSNLEEKGSMEQQREAILNTYHALNEQRQKFDDLTAEYQRFADKYAPASLEQSLQSAAVVAEEDSETIAEQFLSASIPVEQFLTSYIQTRTTSHLRRTKQEILHRQLQELQRLKF